MGSFGPLFLVRFPYNYLEKMRVFKVLDNKSIVKADSRLFWTPIFSTIPL